MCKDFLEGRSSLLHSPTSSSRLSSKKLQLLGSPSSESSLFLGDDGPEHESLFMSSEVVSFSFSFASSSKENYSSSPSELDKLEDSESLPRCITTGALEDLRSVSLLLISVFLRFSTLISGIGWKK